MNPLERVAPVMAADLQLDNAELLAERDALMEKCPVDASEVFDQEAGG